MRGICRPVGRLLRRLPAALELAQCAGEMSALDKPAMALFDALSLRFPAVWAYFP